MTTTGVQTVPHKEAMKNLPCFTIRPLPSFKTNRFHFTIKDYVENSFTLEDIFENGNLKDMRKKSLSIEEHRSINYGRIFVLCFNDPKSAFDNTDIILKNLSYDIDVYIYSKGSEFWFTILEPPEWLNPVRVNTQNNDGIISATVTFSEIQTKALNMPHKPCRTYTLTEVVGEQMIFLFPSVMEKFGIPGGNTWDRPTR
jgi:hypothetical protein